MVHRQTADLLARLDAEPSRAVRGRAGRGRVVRR